MPVFTRSLALAATALALGGAVVAGCSKPSAGLRSRDELALNHDLRHPTPLTVAPPDTDSRQNGTPSAGLPAGSGSGGGQAKGQAGGISSTGGPG